MGQRSSAPRSSPSALRYFPTASRRRGNAETVRAGQTSWSRHTVYTSPHTTRRRRAPQAAGVIHTDFEKGFIRAEVIAYDDFITYGSEAKVKEAGKMRVEGKEYIVKDGDIMHFRFNV